MLLEPECSKRDCIHFQGVDQPDGTEMTERVICKAFLDGIPNEISYGDNLHLTPLPEQENDIVFEGPDD
mgnify:CR=1 FL=1